MKRKQPFNKIEKLLLFVPTWIFVSVAVGLIGCLALWVHEDNNSKSKCNTSGFLSEYTELVCYGASTLLQGAESIAIVAAVILFFKEIPDRKAKKHYEAWQVIDNAAAATQLHHGIYTSYARKNALEDLSKDGVSLSSIVLSRADLSRIDLSYTDLSNANLIGSNLSNANLSNANLTGAHLMGADLKGANLSNANLSNAFLSQADLNKAQLQGSNFSGASLGGSHFYMADLRDTDLSNTYFFKAELTDANLSRANLSGANLDGANLGGADLSGANLREAKFSGARDCSLQQVQSAENWETATYDPEFRNKLGIEPQQIDE
jgi:BTB/POZ domain-containing protein KCTD9